VAGGEGIAGGEGVGGGVMPSLGSMFKDTITINKWIWTLGAFTILAALIFSVPLVFGATSFVQSSGFDYSNLIAGFGGALLGAVVGGITARWLWLEQQYEKDRAAAFGLLTKAQKYYSDFANPKKLIDESIEKSGNQLPASAMLWQRIVPISGIPRTMDLKSEDYIILMEASEYELVQDLVTLSMRHDALLDHLANFNRLRQEMRSLMPNAVQLKAGSDALASFLTPQEDSALLPRAMELESIATALKSYLEEDLSLAEKTLTAIGPAIRKQLKDKKFPVLKVTGDSPSK
jgi:hypothetical protein